MRTQGNKLLAAVILSAGFLFFPAAGSGDRLLSAKAEESASEEMLTEANENIAETEPEADLYDTAAVIASAAAGAAKSMDMEDLESDLNMISALLESEDFKSLMSYQEVRELLEMGVEKAAEFVLAEPDLTGKICETIGVSPSTVQLIVELLRIAGEDPEHSEEWIRTFTEQLKEGDGAGMEELLGDPEVRRKLIEITVFLLETVSEETTGGETAN